MTANIASCARCRTITNPMPPSWRRLSSKEPREVSTKEIILFASGDLRESANVQCWPAQKAMEDKLAGALSKFGYTVRRGHPFKPDLGHGFIASQREGMDAFATIDPDAKVIVA